MFKRLTLFLASITLAILTACASAPSVNSQLKAAYDTTGAYVDMTATSLMRGRITVAQAEKASANAKKARETIDAAALALGACKPPTPCTDYLSLITSLQPTLYEFERELRAQQGAKP